MKRSIRVQKIYGTGGSHPILVDCNDFHQYIVKYKIGSSPISYNLFNEYIGSSFLKLWKLHTPDFDFIQVNASQIFNFINNNNKENLNLSISNFDTICFGTKFSNYFFDIQDLTNKYSAIWKNISQQNKIELLLIALFDIWICNDDRTAYNPNLMCDIKQNNRFVPIDHQFIFNSSNLQYDLYEISWYDSILYHELCFSLFKQSDLTETTLLNIQKRFFISVNQCQTNLKQIISQIPQRWNIDQNKMLLKLEKQLFSDSWKKQTWQTFCDFLQELSKQIK